jgi:hypothetical protein
VAEPALDPVELGVLSAWARAVAHALLVGGSVGEVLAQADRGAHWRAAAATAEPSDRLQAAIAMLGRAAAAAEQADPGHRVGRPSVPAMQQAVVATADPGDVVGALACTVLASRLDRFAAQAVPAPRGAPSGSRAEQAR